MRPYHCKTLFANSLISLGVTLPWFIFNSFLLKSPLEYRFNTNSAFIFLLYSKYLANIFTQRNSPVENLFSAKGTLKQS